jgi:HSP20 family protein
MLNPSAIPIRNVVARGKNHLIGIERSIAMVNMIPWGRRRNTGESGLSSIRGEMGRLLEDFFEPFRSESNEFGWGPALEVYEHKNELVVTAELPGMNPDDIDVTVIGNQLIIAGEKHEEREHKHEGIYRSERRYGAFRRTIELQHEVDPQNVKVDFENGVLKLRIPHSEAQQPRRIPINVGGRGSTASTQPATQPAGTQRPPTVTSQPQTTSPIRGNGDGQSRRR